MPNHESRCVLLPTMPVSELSHEALKKPIKTTRRSECSSVLRERKKDEKNRLKRPVSTMNGS